MKTPGKHGTPQIVPRGTILGHVDIAADPDCSTWNNFFRDKHRLEISLVAAESVASIGTFENCTVFPLESGFPITLDRCPTL